MSTVVVTLQRPPSLPVTATQSTGISIGSSCTVADSVSAGPFCLSVIWTVVRTSSLPGEVGPAPPGQAALVDPAVDVVDR